jgi:hypothetical protein
MWKLHNTVKKEGSHFTLSVHLKRHKCNVAVSIGPLIISTSHHRCEYVLLESGPVTVSIVVDGIDSEKSSSTSNVGISHSFSM